MSNNTDLVPYQKKGEVIKYNSFIRCSNNLTAVQRKSFAVLLKETIDTIIEYGEKKRYSMPLVEYRKIMDFPDSMPTKYIASELRELMTKIIEWDLDEEGYGERSVMLAYFGINRNKGTLSWEFSNALLEKFSTSGYTPLKLSIILSFTSKYSLALYENLQMRKGFNKCTFNLKEFRALMGVEEGEHPRMDSFKARVLHPAIREINEKADMFLYCEDIKQGAKIVGFEFRWKSLSIEEMKERNKRKAKIEGYREALSPYFGSKVKIDGKWYTLTKDGFVRGGKIFGGKDIVESYDKYSILKREGLVTEIKEKQNKIQNEVKSNKSN